VSARPAVALVVYDSGPAEVRDLATGLVRASVELPPADYAPDNPQMIGDKLVLRHPVRTRVALTGYDLTTLGLRWSRVDRAGRVGWTDCGSRLCARTPEVAWTLDPADGTVSSTPGDGAAWRSVRGRDDLVARDLDDKRLLVASNVPAQPARPRPIGALPAGYRDCRAGDTALVCRLDPGGLAVVALPRGPS
jgi:outer membrane protein assembly factor BamB